MLYAPNFVELGVCSIFGVILGHACCFEFICVRVCHGVVMVLPWCCHSLRARPSLKSEHTCTPSPRARTHHGPWTDHRMASKLSGGSWMSFFKCMTLGKHADIRLIGPSAVVCNSILSTPLHPIYIPYTPFPPISDVLSAERRLTHPFRSNRPPTHHPNTQYNILQYKKH